MVEIVCEITDEHDLETGKGLTPDGDNISIMGGDVRLDEESAMTCRTPMSRPWRAV